MKTAYQLIKEKRIEQRCKGYTAKHDDLHINGELVCEFSNRYLQNYKSNIDTIMIFDDDAIDNAIDDLANAAACITAEIERLQRLKE